MGGGGVLATQAGCPRAHWGPPASTQQAAPLSVRRPWLALLWFNCAMCSVTKCKTLGMSCKGGKLRDPVESLDLTERGLGCPLVF